MPEADDQPTTVRELGIVIGGLRDDVQRLEQRLESYIVSHGEQYKALVSEVDETTDWRQRHEVYEGLARWLIGSNLAVLIGLVIIVVEWLR